MARAADGLDTQWLRLPPKLLSLLEATDDLLARAIRRSQNRALALSIRRIERAWRLYFQRQGAWWLSEYLPSLSIFLEAKLPSKVEKATEALAAFDAAAPASTTLAQIGIAMQTAAAELAKRLETVVSFDLANPRAAEYMRRKGAELVTKINETSRKRLRTLLTAGIDEGWSYGKVASAIRREFQDFSRRRALLIATTEAGNAYTEGMAIVGHDLQARGLKMQKRWIATRGPCPEICGPNSAASWIPMGQWFPSGADQPLGHPRCRCALDLRSAP